VVTENQKSVLDGQSAKAGMRELISGTKSSMVGMMEAIFGIRSEMGETTEMVSGLPEGINLPGL
jgi:hypothetical protein